MAASLLLTGGCQGDVGSRYSGTVGIGGLTKGDDPDGDGDEDDEGKDTEGDEDEDDGDDDDGPGGGPGGPDGRWDVGYDDVPGGAEDEDEECASVTESAQATPQPADIVFVIDNSGSMGFEAGLVQNEMNGFSQQITDSGIDVQVALISSYPGNGYGMCIDAPLGNGGCPDSDDNPPTFEHVNQIVGSTNGLSLTLSRYDDWAPSMREGASKHFIIVTDDNSSMSANQFDSQLTALDPMFDGYKFHGIVSMSNCPDAASIGSVYMALGDLTGGLITDLCDQDFEPIFDLLSTEVIEGADLACLYDIPPPPDGGEFDPTLVNVDFDGGGGLETIGYVASAAECAGVLDGWHYDNAFEPTQIIMCPQTCDRFQDLLLATIEIRFGCATVPAG